MASEEDDFFGEEDDDLDAETLQLLDQAEKQHAAAFSASQLPAATQKNAHRATTEPVKTLPQAHKQFAPNSALSTSNGRLPNASQQQRAVSARPAVQHVNRVQAGPASSQQRQQQQQYTASQQPNRTYNSNQYANAVAGPSTSNYVRRVVKPVYRDDFPNVDIDETGKQYRPRNVSAQPSAAAGANLGATSQPIFDTEKDELKRQLAEVSSTENDLIH